MGEDPITGITLLGLGPGDAGLLTRQAWQVLEGAEVVYLRTRQHPATGQLPKSLRIQSFDELYDEAESFEAVYEGIVQRVLELGREPEGVLYAVPGHPFVAEATAPEIARRAREEGIPVRVVEGLSFLEPTCSALGLDPFPQTALVDALEIAAWHVPSFSPSAPALIAQMYSRQVASDVKLTLMSLYPDEHPVCLVHAAGTAQQRVEELPLYAIDHSDEIGLLTTLYLPPLSPDSSFEAFLELVAHLRAPEGCPWDREQTHLTLRSHMLEEAYEVIESLDAEDPDALREELGDLLLQILLHAQIATEDGEFNMADVLRGIHRKLVRRHPHVFGDDQSVDAHGVLRNWERLKAEERLEKGEQERSLLDGIARALPALTQAEQVQRRAARVGFDWPDVQGVLDKLEEELVEVRSAGSDTELTDEIGDVLFAVANLARWYGVDPEGALRQANRKFRTRFSHIESRARELERDLAEMSLDEMEALWQEAKNM